MTDLSAEDSLRLARLLGELARRRETRLFDKLYPDETTEWPDGTVFHARHLYAKHLEHYAAGATYRQRCAMAANRCLTPWTYLETPAGLALSADTWTSEDARVITWDGESKRAAQSGHGLVVGIEPAFRLVLDNGRYFDCSRRHRVLTAAGWLSLDQLVCASSGLRSWHRAEDYQASCDADGYLGDRPLRSVAGIDLSPPPSQGGAQERGPLFFALPDEVEPILQRIHAFPDYARLSSRDDLRRHAALFGMFAGPSSASPVVSPSDRTLSAVQSALASFRDREGGQSLLAGRARDESRVHALIECLVEACRRQEACEAGRELWRSHDYQTRGGSVLEWCRDAGHMARFYPFDHPSLLGGRRIECIVQIGLQPIIDAHVPETNCYFAAGVIHHNTGKTLSGAYEVAAHATGRYPKWWQGRRFERPVRIWAAGKTNETTRDIVQANLFGAISHSSGRKGFSGSGVVPGDTIGRPTWKQGVADLADVVPVQHVSGGFSLVGLKSYQQGRGSFEGTAQHVVWLDEEPPRDVYGECLIRTATTNGIVILTFTPLEGMSETVLEFMPQDSRPDAT